jgi:hypothetical protein
LPIHFRNGPFSAFSRFHLHETKALALACVAVSHNFGAPNGAHGAKPFQQIRFNRIPVELRYKKFHG